MLVATDAAQKRNSVDYKAISWSVLNYGATIWASTVRYKFWNNLQTQQNIAFRTITGCVKMSDINGLHNESATLSVKGSTEKKEPFLTVCHQNHRADHKTTPSTSSCPKTEKKYTFRYQMKQQKNYKKQLKLKEKMRSKVSTDTQSILS